LFELTVLYDNAMWMSGYYILSSILLLYALAFDADINKLTQNKGDI